jgi:hypothetical protein
MMEEISITLVNSLVFSAMVFFPLKLTGDFILFWLIFLTTTSIGIGECPGSRSCSGLDSRVRPLMSQAQAGHFWQVPVSQDG